MCRSKGRPAHAFLCEHGRSGGGDADKIVYMREIVVGQAGCLGLYHPSCAATGAPTAAVLCTAADPKQREGRWETPCRCFPAPLPLFRRAFHARSAFSFPLQCPKKPHRQRFPASEIKSIIRNVRQPERTPRFAGRCGFSPNAASRARPFWARDADGAGPKASVGVQRDSIPLVGFQRVKPFGAENSSCPPKIAFTALSLKKRRRGICRVLGVMADGGRF